MSLAAPSIVSAVRLAFVVLLLAFGARVEAEPPSAGGCGALERAKLPNGEIFSAVLEPAQPYRVAGEADPIGLPPRCVVRAHIRSGPGSHIVMEVWLPLRAAWNERIQAVGNGGYRGEIPYDALAQALLAGYAAVGSDGGHATPPNEVPESVAFGAGHPGRIADWAGRSVHAAITAAKPLVAAYEGKVASHAYFASCSTGGQQGLMEAQRYPSDFDGILVGAPGNNRTGLNAGFLWRFALNNAAPTPTIPADKLLVINQAVIRACDELDGVKDGVIDDPRTCRFRPQSVACETGQDEASCLTPPQLAVLSRLEKDARDPKSGNLIYPAWPMGSENGWGPYVAGRAPARLGVWRDWVFDDPDWSWRTVDWTRDLASARRKLGGLVDATDPHLSAFRVHGGKLIMYQGWADPIGNAADTINTYQAMVAANPDAGRFIRLYMVPGMGHCTGGPGTDRFDLLTPLRAWVEDDEAPGEVVASHVENGRVTRQRPLCAFPANLHYRGRGDPNLSESFNCATQGIPGEAGSGIQLKEPYS